MTDSYWFNPNPNPTFLSFPIFPLVSERVETISLPYVIRQPTFCNYCNAPTLSPFFDSDIAYFTCHDRYDTKELQGVVFGWLVIIPSPIPVTKVYAIHTCVEHGILCRSAVSVIT